jgi:hypothetical protein
MTANPIHRHNPIHCAADPIHRAADPIHRAANPIHRHDAPSPNPSRDREGAVPS